MNEDKDVFGTVVDAVRQPVEIAAFRAINLDVNDDVWVAVDWAVGWAVRWTVYRAVDQAVDGAVDGAVAWAGDRAVSGATYTGKGRPHLHLGWFLLHCQSGE